MHSDTAPPAASALTLRRTPPLERADHRGARQEFLDALRGVAALLVAAVHGLERLDQPLFDTIFRSIHLGHAGVTLFFICSGFIIPISLAQQSSQRAFWVRRVLRLYPLYWVSIAIALITQVSLDVPLTGGVESLAIVAANLLMIQSLVGLPDLRGLFWTLGIELQFYLLVAVLFRLRLLDRTVALAGGFLVGGVLFEALSLRVLGVPVGHNFLIYIGMMFVGTNFYRVSIGAQRWRTLLGLLLLLALALVALTLISGTPSLQLARAAAFGVFCAGFTLRASSFPGWTLYLGLISYSLYLMHPFAFALPVGGLPMPVGLTIWLAATVALSAVTYALVEAPAQRLARRLTRSYGSSPSKEA